MEKAEKKLVSTYVMTEAIERKNVGKKGGGRKKTKEGEIST